MPVSASAAAGLLDWLNPSQLDELRTPRRERHRILLVTRDPVGGLMLSGMLQDDYFVDRVATETEALGQLVLDDKRPDLILLDSGWTDSEAYATLARLKSEESAAGIPVIVLVPLIDDSAATKAIELGAADFIPKPFSHCIVKARLANQLELSRSRAELESIIEERTRELQHSRLELISRLSRAAEYRDSETGMHILRMSKYSQIVALASGASANKAKLVLDAAPMHDIGKIGIPDSVLLKPGKLDPGEWKIMQSHCKIGGDIMGHGDSELARSAALAAFTHHERYDGSGYPAGLSGESIPWIGRVVALADVFDALTSDRPYKRAWPMELAFDLIRTEAGTHFDPELAAAFLEAKTEIAEVMALYPD
jgi:putative two-component system response regulator